jgi:hypothetical protein
MWSADLCYFFKPTTGLYLNSGVGPVLNSPEFGNPLTGFGVYFGAGWEFIKHFSVGADLAFASVSNDNIDLTATAMVLYLKALGY